MGNTCGELRHLIQPDVTGYMVDQARTAAPQKRGTTREPPLSPFSPTPGFRVPGL